MIIYPIRLGRLTQKDNIIIMITIIKFKTFIMKINNPKLLLTPLVLATTVAFANWGAESEETPMNNATTNDEDRSAFIDLTTMIAAGDIEGAQSQVIEAATDQGVRFTQILFRKILPNG